MISATIIKKAARLLPFFIGIAVCLLSNVTQAASQREVVAGVQSKVVKIFGAGGFSKLKSYGTGILVSSEGHIATVWSSVLDSPEVTVILDNGRRYQAKVIGAEPTLDVAIIKIPAQELPYFDLSKSRVPSAGTRVLGFSNMFKVATGNEPVSVLRGVVSSVTKLTARRGGYEVPYEGRVLIVDAITNNPGAGGGALTTLSGELIGLIGKELRDTRSNIWINYSMPIVDLRETIQEIITGKFTKKPINKFAPTKLTLNYTMTDFGVVLVPNILERTPAFVDSILPGSDAEKSGIKVDDLIVFVDDEKIDSCTELKKIIGQAEPGDLLKLTIQRGGVLKVVEWSVLRKKKVEK